MTEKELDSMATVQMKQEYAASEVYSTASEPPPAYKRRSSSVQIAKIVAFTVIVSSFVIGSFILASAYLQAKASCDQMQALDSVLEKELMLETLQQVSKQETPRADALIGNESEDSDLQSLDNKKGDENPKSLESSKKDFSSQQSSSNDLDSDSSFSDSDESDDLQKAQVKIPLELDLSELATALLENNHKSRMNCVVERKHAEEFVDSPSKTMQLPFGLNLTTEPKKQKITGERIAIFCESGSENSKQENDDAEPIRPVFIPIQRLPIPFGAQPQQIPLTHMPQNMQPPQTMMQQIPPPFQQLPIRQPIPAQMMQAPRLQPQLHIQVQRIPIREFRFQQNTPDVSMSGQNRQQMPQLQLRSMPFGLALQEAGITPEDIKNIQRLAEERFTEELRNMATDESLPISETADISDEENDNDSQSNDENGSQSQQSSQPPEPRQTLHPPMPEQQILQIGRGAYGRSLPTPVRIPVPMMQTHEMSQETHDGDKPHYVQPRSIRSVDDAFLHREKRAKRFACNCQC